MCLVRSTMVIDGCDIDDSSYFEEHFGEFLEVHRMPMDVIVRRL